MAAYMVMAVFPVVLALFFPGLEKQRKVKNIFFMICGAVMLFIMGCRHYSLGSVDTAGYYSRMEYAISCKTWEQFYNPELYEKGFQVFLYVLSRIFYHPQWLLVVTSLLFIISVFYFIDHNSDDAPLSIALYIALGLMMFHLQGMRQAMAMSICLFAYEQAKNKHLIRFVLLVLFATAFHQTAIVFFPVYIFCRMKFSGKNLALMCAVAIIVISNATKIIEIANTYFDRTYTDTVDRGGFIAVSIYVIILILTLVFDKQIKSNSLQTPLFYILFVGFVTYILRYFGALASERISFYFIFAQLALLPKAVGIVVKEQRMIMRLLILVLAVALMIYRLNGSEFVPYVFYWEGQ